MDNISIKDKEELIAVLKEKGADSEMRGEYKFNIEIDRHVYIGMEDDGTIRARVEIDLKDYKFNLLTCHFSLEDFYTTDSPSTKEMPTVLRASQILLSAFVKHGAEIDIPVVANQKVEITKTTMTEPRESSEEMRLSGMVDAFREILNKGKVILEK
jgi:hypothetical protein